MPQPPEDLSRIIKQMAIEAAKKLGKVLIPAAVERIGTLPPDYAKMTMIAVDQARLFSTIYDIIQLAASSKLTIELDDIENALKKAECHYLWFC